ncbi:tetratricopeptide repeat protein [Streptococcus porcorum]|uniref:Tetratricopeptide (TPR) repeat protein n=1 Tax=Streptococcus porcorum TaxID=701526 RepID=A0ABV2JHJ3_9STRE
MTNSEKMVASIQAQDLEHAEKYFNRALKEDDQETLLSLGEYLESIGFFPQAKLIYEQLIGDYPELALSLAQIAAEDGQIEEAFLYLDTIKEGDEAYLESLLVMADLYQMEGLTDVARDKLLLASEFSQEPLIYLGLAEMELELGNYQTAISFYASLDNRSILEETGISTYQRIGLAYASLGKFEAAIEFLEKAVEIEYDDQTVYELALILLDQGESQKSEIYFKQLDTINPDFEGYELAYAKALHAEHKLQDALRVLQQGLAKNSFDNQLLLFASQLSYENHDAKAAEHYLLQAKEIAEDQEEIDLRLSTLYLEREAYEDVIALEREGIDQVLTRWNIAKAHQALENEEEAFELYQALEDDLGTNPEFLKDYAYLLYEFAYRVKAKEIAKRYLQLVPDDSEVAAYFEI